MKAGKDNNKENLPPESKKWRSSGRTAKHKKSLEEAIAAALLETAQEDQLAKEVTENLFITKGTKDG